jgi:hypothetical protein
MQRRVFPMFPFVTKILGISVTPRKTKTADSRRAQLSVQQLEDRVLMAANLLNPVAPVAPAKQAPPPTKAAVQVVEPQKIAVVQAHAEVVTAKAVVTPAAKPAVTAPAKAATVSPVAKIQTAVQIKQVTVTAPKGKVVAQVSNMTPRAATQPTKPTPVATAVTTQSSLKSKVGPSSANVVAGSLASNVGQLSGSLATLGDGLVTSRQTMVGEDSPLSSGGNFVVTWAGWAGACIGAASATGPGAVVGWGICAAGAAVMAGNFASGDGPGFSGTNDATSSQTPVGGPSDPQPEGGNGTAPTNTEPNQTPANGSTNSTGSNNDNGGQGTGTGTAQDNQCTDSDNNYPPPPLDDGSCVNPDADSGGGILFDNQGHMVGGPGMGHQQGGGVTDPGANGGRDSGPATQDELTAAGKAIAFKIGSNDGGSDREQQGPPTQQDAQHVQQVRGGGVTGPTGAGHTAGASVAVSAAVSSGATSHMSH